VSDHDKALRVPRQYLELAAGAVTADVACPQGTRALHIGTAGNISATMKGGSVTAMPVQPGLLLGEFTSVLAAGSTVTGVWAAV
jgi:hypothetical protein